jgi:TonB family protein
VPTEAPLGSASDDTRRTSARSFTIAYADYADSTFNDSDSLYIDYTDHANDCSRQDCDNSAATSARTLTIALALFVLFIVAPLTAARAQDTSSAAPKKPDAYFEFQVEQTALPLPGGMRGVAYPSELRSKGIEGTVLAQFVVGTDGKPDMRTFKVLKTSHELFSKAVYDAVAKMRFQPAQIDGRTVRQVVQQPFVFALGH